MAIKTKDEIIKSITGLLGERTDDEALAIIEDVTDTMGDYETKLSDTTNWKKKYEDNDSEWRKKYKERFTMGTSSKNSEEEDDEDDEPPKVLKFEDLFETKK